MQQQPTQDSTLIYRIDTLEKMVQQLQTQLSQYVPAKENELQLKIIKDTVERIEREIGNAKSQLTEMNTKLVDSEMKARERDSEQKQSQANLQLRFFYALLGLIGTIVVGLLLYYFTHAH